MNEEPVRYNGRDITLKGAGDRFVLPPEFRKLVRQSSNGERILCLQTHPDRPCLMGFGLSRRRELDAQILEEEANAVKLGQNFSREDRQIELFTFETFPFDDSGRFVMPPDFIEHAGITDSIFLQASGTHFLIYSPQVLETLGDDHAIIKRNCAGVKARLAASKGGK